MGGRRPRPCLRHLPRPDLDPRPPPGTPAKVHRRAGRLPALDLRQPPLGREPLGATEGVAGDRNPPRENRQVLPRRPLLRPHTRLAQGLTGLSPLTHNGPVDKLFFRSYSHLSDLEILRPAFRLHLQNPNVATDPSRVPPSPAWSNNKPTGLQHKPNED